MRYGVVYPEKLFAIYSSMHQFMFIYDTVESD